jgi:hypothetical protein
MQHADPTLEAVNAIPVVGEPLAWGLGFAMLLFVVFTDSWARSLVTVAHEGDTWPWRCSRSADTRASRSTTAGRCD